MFEFLNSFFFLASASISSEQSTPVTFLMKSSLSYNSKNLPVPTGTSSTDRGWTAWTNCSTAAFSRSQRSCFFRIFSYVAALRPRYFLDVDSMETVMLPSFHGVVEEFLVVRVEVSSHNIYGIFILDLEATPSHHSHWFAD